MFADRALAGCPPRLDAFPLPAAREILYRDREFHTNLPVKAAAAAARVECRNQAKVLCCDIKTSDLPLPSLAPQRAIFPNVAKKG